MSVESKNEKELSDLKVMSEKIQEDIKSLEKSDYDNKAVDKLMSDLSQVIASAKKITNNYTDDKDIKKLTDIFSSVETLLKK